MCALLGTPSAAIWPEFPALPLTPKVQLPAQPYNELPSRLAKARPTGAALDLVGALLTYDPARRCTADGALAHGYFAEPPAAVVPDMCRAAPSSAKESEPARSSVLAPESGAENRCAALLPTAAPARNGCARPGCRRRCRGGGAAQAVMFKSLESRSRGRRPHARHIFRFRSFPAEAT